MSLTLLVGVLGERAINDLLDIGALKFVRFNGGLGYVGNGRGLTDYQIARSPGQPLPIFGASDEAVAWALSGLNSKPDIKALTPKVIGATKEIAIRDILDTIKHQTYGTILASDELRRAFSVRNTDLNELSGIGQAGVRVWAGFDKPKTDAPDEIDVVLRIARSYLEVI